jgi:hypothetical protein
VYIPTPKATTFYLRWLGSARKRRPKLRAMAGSPSHFERINAWEEKMRLGADQFLFIRDGLFIFFDPANCSPIIIQTPLRALCVYKKLM